MSVARSHPKSTVSCRQSQPAAAAAKVLTGPNTAAQAVLTPVVTPVPGGRQAEKSAATQLQLIRATITCLNETGYHGTSTNDVVARAGSSRGALLHHFPNRHALFAATASYLTESWLTAMEGALSDSDTELLRMESAIIMVTYLVTQPEFNAFMELTIAARTDTDLRAELQQLRHRFVGASALALRRLFPGMIATSGDFAAEFAAMIHFLEGLALSHMIMRDSDDLQASLRWWVQNRISIADSKPVPAAGAMPVTVPVKSKARQPASTIPAKRPTRRKP